MRTLPKQVVIGLINLYQKISCFFPRHQCRFFPTCSQYSLEAVKKYGVFKGLKLGLKRISRCHPWHTGGFDPLK